MRTAGVGWGLHRGGIRGWCWNGDTAIWWTPLSVGYSEDVFYVGKRRRYAPEHRAGIVELVRAGRSADELAPEFEPSAKAIRRWVEQTARDEGLRKDGLTMVEWKELCELHWVKLERDILATETAWFAWGERIPGHVSGALDVPPAGSLAEQVLRVAHSERARENAALTAEIVEIHAMSGAAYVARSRRAAVLEPQDEERARPVAAEGAGRGEGVSA